MKKGIAIILAIILLVMLCPYYLCSNTTITDDPTTISINIPENAVCITPDNVYDSANESLLLQVGKTPTYIQQMFDNGYVFFAFTNDKKYIINMHREQTELSKSVINLIELDTDTRNVVMKKLCGDILNTADSVEPISKDGALFYKVVYRNPSDNLPSIYYITILNGYCVNLTLDSMVTDITSNGFSMMDTMFNSMSFTVVNYRSSTKAKANTAIKWITIAVILILLVVLFFVIRAIIRDIQKSKEEADWRSKVRRKPRR